MLDRKQCLELYDNAKCDGEVGLFASTSREAFTVARTRCAACPVVALCYEHVNPVEDKFTGTCAGRLFYEGKDVTDAPEALPPPVFRLKDVDLVIVEEFADAAGLQDWEDHSVSTLMTVSWMLRRKLTFNRLAKISGLEKTYVISLVQGFDDGAPADFKEFIAAQISLARRIRSITLSE